MLYKQVPLEEGQEIVYVGVHVINWQPEWGEPTVGFVPVDDPDEEEYWMDSPSGHEHDHQPGPPPPGGYDTPF